ARVTGLEGPRPPQPRLLDVDGRRGSEGGAGGRRHRRHRASRRGQALSPARRPYHHPRPAGPPPETPQLPAPPPKRTADRGGGRRHRRDLVDHRRAAPDGLSADYPAAWEVPFIDRGGRKKAPEMRWNRLHLRILKESQFDVVRTQIGGTHHLPRQGILDSIG